jgi:hypothetical protein
MKLELRAREAPVEAGTISIRSEESRVLWQLMPDGTIVYDEKDLLEIVGLLLAMSMGTYSVHQA